MTTATPPPRSARSAYADIRFDAMSTPCHIAFRARSHSQAEQFECEARAWLVEFERQFSRFTSGSLVSRINQAAGTSDWIELDEEAQTLFRLCDWFTWKTGGVFDAASLPVVDLWDYRKPRAVPPTDSEAKQALSLCGWSKVERRPDAVRLPAKGMSIDFGGIGKEYAVDRVFEMARRRAIDDILVNFGNDLRVHGSPPEGGPWRVGLERPDDPGRCWGALAARDCAVTTAGDYLRHATVSGRRYGHILDPRSGRPVNNGVNAVSVVASTCTEAGVLATSVFILGGDEGLRFLDVLPEAEGCIVSDGQSRMTRRFHAYLIPT